MSSRISHYHLRAVTIATTLLLSSCGGGGGGGSNAPSTPAVVMPPRPVEQSDLQIAQQLYDGTPRTPDGFHVDAKPSGQEHVATVHLKNTDLDHSLVAPYPQHELCTDDWTEALSWSEASAQAAPNYADLVATNDDSRFHEFDRARAGDPDLYVRERVFKCAYLNRATADLRSPPGSAGTFNQRPLGSIELRALSEYLWQFTTYNNFGHVVLKSSGETTATALTHTLFIANLMRNGLSATCDRVDVIAWRHRADTTTGVLQLDIETLWSFGARDGAGGRELCR